MKTRALGLLLVAQVIGCNSPTATPDDAAPGGSKGSDAAGSAADTTPVEVHALGVQGFLIRRGHDAVMTAPLFTRQSAIQVTFNIPITSDTQAIDSKLAGEPLADLRAIVTGHAHYDHFLDVPHVLEMAPGASVYTNLSGRHILAALAPDRPSCTNAAQTPAISRDRVVALDDALASYVDYTNCPDQRPAGAPLQGQWLHVPNSNVRIMGFCSMHPAQVGPYHFGQGAIGTDQCTLPAAAAGWLEGQTLALVIDFLDAKGDPAFRIFYQDAPTNPPIGHITPAVLADKSVDLALLCVGSSDAVEDHPTKILANITPRFAFSGHWEDFFQPLGSALQPIPLLDLDGYVQRAETAMSGDADAPLTIDGTPSSTRHALVKPGSRFVVPLAP